MSRLPWLALTGLMVIGSAGCTNQVLSQDTRSGPFSPGAATIDTTLFGREVAPCTKAEIDSYPKQIDRPSASYYAGPWCREVKGGTAYVWSYGRPLTSEQSPQSVRVDVNRDALTLVSDLKAQDFVVLCGPHADDPTTEDVAIGLGKPGQSQRIFLTVRGQDLPRAGSQAPQGSSTPLSLAITSVDGPTVPANPRVARTC